MRAPFGETLRAIDVSPPQWAEGGDFCQLLRRGSPPRGGTRPAGGAPFLFLPSLLPPPLFVSPLPLFFLSPFPLFLFPNPDGKRKKTWEMRWGEMRRDEERWGEMKSEVSLLQWAYCNELTAMSLIRWAYKNELITMSSLEWVYYCELATVSLLQRASDSEIARMSLTQ